MIMEELPNLTTTLRFTPNDVGLYPTPFTRVEFIGPEGRQVLCNGKVKIDLSFQDEIVDVFRTLKIFASELSESTDEFLSYNKAIKLNEIRVVENNQIDCIVRKSLVVNHYGEWHSTQLTYIQDAYNRGAKLYKLK